jgi:uncharacterized protein
MRSHFFVSGVVACALMACTSAPQAPQKPQVLLKGPSSEVAVTVEIADNNVSRAKGLMGRTELARGSGMLFVFDEPKRAVKNTLIPLDVIFFDAGLRFVSVSSMVPCTKDPCRTYPSAKEVLYALEVENGFAKRHGVGTGWTLTLPR